MNPITNFFQNLFPGISSFGVTDVIDIAVVAFIFYKLLRVIHSTSAERAAIGVVLLLVLDGLTDILHLYALNWILDKIIEIGLIALVIVFQPELRRELERFGGGAFRRLTGKEVSRNAEQSVISATVAACEIMAKERVGVLLAFERNTSLDEYFKTGTLIDAKVTEQLLRNLFFPKASLHDGAVIIRGDRVAAAGCVMPLSSNAHLSSDLGTRHRAGVGTSELSDAVVVIVSEETGTISVAINGMLKRHLAPKTLEKLLVNELMSTEEPADKTILSWLKGIIKSQFGKRTK